MHDSAWPTSPDAMTLAWLTDVLRADGALAHGDEVLSIDVTPLVELGGVNGETFRLHLSYADGRGAPASVVAKFPSRSPGALGVARFQRWYEREVRFYRELAPDTPARTPRAFAAEIDQDSRFVLLMEDFAPWEQGDQITGCGLERARAGVTAAAALHARWWDARLADRTWLPLTTVGLDHAMAVQGAVRRGWQVAEAAGQIPPALASYGGAIVHAYPALLDRIAQPPLTAVHGDYRLDNLFFAEDGETGVIDWQFCCRARGTYDVGYFVGLNMSPEDRAQHEETLLVHYVEMLGERGVQGYDVDTCRQDYRVSLLLALAVFLIGAAGEQPNERMQRVHEVGIARLVRAIEETEALRIL